MGIILKRALCLGREVTILVLQYSQGPDLRTHYKDGRAWKKEKDKKL